jgi:YidC/Oxa1 family membrane protein insertase
LEKRTLLAIILSAIVWIAWFIIFQPEQPTQQPAVSGTEQQHPAGTADQTPAPVETVSSVKVESLTPVNAGHKETEIPVKTETFEFLFTTKGASIKKVRYITRDVELTVGTNPFTARGDLGFTMHFSDREFMMGNSLDTALWSYASDGLNVIFSTDISIDGIPVRIEKVYTLKEQGLDFAVEYRLTNRGRANLKMENGKIIISPSEMLGPTLDFTNSYNGLKGIFSINGDYKQDYKGGGFFSKPEVLKKHDGSAEWVGVMSRYFLVIMIPQGITGSGALFDNREHAGFRTGINMPLKELKPGEKTAFPFRVYLGEKNKDFLAKIDKSIVDAADYSAWIEPIRYFVVWSLLSINGFVGNLGWALVIFSLLTKIVFMPLTKKSTESMKKMQELNPKLTALKEKFKDKPDQLQKKMMELYKENKVNPMGGCLPILLQMPFFFALYSALINSIDLWNAPFIFWITDLSMPDTVLTISGFNLNILPLVMTASTFLQQRLTTVDTGSQQQKMMMMMMPFIFIFIFWSMPSGLVLYWTLQNVFQVIHQVTVNRFSKK